MADRWGSRASDDYSTDGAFKLVATASYDNTARLWDASTSALLAILFGSGADWFSLDPAGRWRAGGDGSRILTYVDPEDQNPLRTIWLADDLPHLRQP